MKKNEDFKVERNVTAVAVCAMAVTSKITMHFEDRKMSQP